MATAPSKFESFETALLASEYGFTADDVALIEEGEGEHGIVSNWSRATFDLVMGTLKGRAAFEVVRSVKSGVEPEARQTVVPAEAPYLSAKSEYDPHDPSQFYTDRESGEMYRWDGKGQRSRVIQVEHRRYGDTLLPVEESALLAIDTGFDWFHHGYSVWNRGQKPLADPTQEARDKVRVAMILRGRTTADPFQTARVTPAMAG